MTEVRKVLRYTTKNKTVAFNWMQVKNKVKNKNTWRVAVLVRSRIIIDIDELDFSNVITVRDYYSRLLNKEFTLIKTFAGYHLISEKYEDALQWQYDTCRVVYPFLERQLLQQYIEKVHQFYKDERKKQQINGLDRHEFIQYLSDEFRKSGLFSGMGNFDLLFAINCIWKGYYCLRISRKSLDDIPYEVQL